MPTFLDATGLSKLLQKIKSVFATKTELTALGDDLTAQANELGKTFVHKTGNETIEGTKTFSSTISGSINGNAATATKINRNADNTSHVGGCVAGTALVSTSHTGYGAIWNAPTKNYRISAATYPENNDLFFLLSCSNANIASSTNTISNSLTFNADTGEVIASKFSGLFYGNLYGSNSSIITGNNFGWQVTNGTRTIELMIGSGKVNRGIWDSKLNKWAVYANDSEVILNGRATGSGSDRRIKQDFSDIPDEVLDAWEQVKWTRFRLKKEAVKSDNAPLHVGAVVQDIQKALEDKGIDSKEYAMLYHEPVPDEEGNRPSEDDPSLMNADKWYLKYEEALSIEAAYLRRCNERLSARLNEAVQRIESLEEALKRQTNADIS